MENFDKQIKKHGESFSLEPRQEVWLRLKDELNNKRKRRFAWWWFVPILLATAGAGMYLLTDSSDNKEIATNKIPAASNKQPVVSTKDKHTEKTIASTTPQTKAAASKNIVTPQKSSTAENKSYASGKNAKSKQETGLMQTTGDRTKVIGAEKGTTVLVENKVVNKTSDDKQGILNSNNTQDLNRNDSAISKVADIEKQVDKQNASTDNLSAIAITALEQDKTTTTVTEKPKSNVASKQQKPVKWQFLVSAGASINAEAYEFLQKKNSDSGQLGGIGGGGILQPMAESEPGISILLGVNRTQWISKRWQWKIGASAQLQQMNQKTGIRYDDPIVPSPDIDYSADYFFDSGEELDHRANHYRLFLKSKAGFVPIKKLPLLLTAGISGGVNIYSRYLLPDHINIWYIRSYDRYETFFGAVNIGTEYNFKKGWSAGIEASHDFTKSFQPLDKRNNYWRSIMINIGIPLNIN